MDTLEVRPLRILSRAQVNKTAFTLNALAQCFDDMAVAHQIAKDIPLKSGMASITTLRVASTTCREASKAVLEVLAIYKD